MIAPGGARPIRRAGGWVAMPRLPGKCVLFQFGILLCMIIVEGATGEIRETTDFVDQGALNNLDWHPKATPDRT